MARRRCIRAPFPASPDFPHALSANVEVVARAGAERAARGAERAGQKARNLTVLSCAKFITSLAFSC